MREKGTPTEGERGAHRGRGREVGGGRHTQKQRGAQRKRREKVRKGEGGTKKFVSPHNARSF